MKVSIEKNGLEIKVNGVNCKVTKQDTKGLNKEVVDIEKVVGSTYQKFISLSKLVEGLQEVELKMRRETTSKNYTLTEVEKSEIENLQSKINEIIEVAKSRVVTKSKKLEDMSEEELIRYCEYCSSILEAKKGK